MRNLIIAFLLLFTLSAIAQTMEATVPFVKGQQCGGVLIIDSVPDLTFSITKGNYADAFCMGKPELNGIVEDKTGMLYINNPKTIKAKRADYVWKLTIKITKPGGKTYKSVKYNLKLTESNE